MKKYFLCLLIFLCVIANAQARNEKPILARKSVYAEFMGASLMTGINYDTRFNDYSRWGYRIGLAYTLQDIGKMDFCCGSNDDGIRGINVPLEINYLVGRKATKSKLDLGMGVNLGYYDRNDENLFGYFMFLNIGYRFQPSHGITFRVGLSPKISFGGNSGLIDYVWITSFIPYLSFGYAF